MARARGVSKKRRGKRAPVSDRFMGLAEDLESINAVLDELESCVEEIFRRLEEVERRTGVRSARKDGG